MTAPTLNWTVAIANQIELLCREHTDPEGRVDLVAAKDDFDVWLLATPSALETNVRKITAALFDRFDRQRRPARHGGGQYGLFQPEKWIPIGHDERVWMEQATRDQLILWGAQDDAEFAASAVAQAEKSAWRAEILKAWRITHQNLGDLMRDVYGWEGEAGDSAEAEEEES